MEPSGLLRERSKVLTYQRPIPFWIGIGLCCVGVLVHVRMYYDAKSMGYHMVGMDDGLPMFFGMAAIIVGLALAFYGLLPADAARISDRARTVRVRALDDAPVRFQHVALLVVMGLAVTIDVMKPTTLSFVAPGVAKEYGLRSLAHPHATSVAWLPFSGISGTVLGSFLWGWAADRVGRRASILFAGVVFVSTAICGAMPSFGWNVAMCFVMGLAAGGMLPIAFTLIAETIPARHRGWLVVLIGGDVAGAYVITSWLAGALTPHYTWRILWLLGLPTGLLLIALNKWIPESPRYLIASGQDKAAGAIMRRFGARAIDVEPEEATPVDSATAVIRPPMLWPSLAVTALAISAGLLTYGFQIWVPTNLQHLGFTEVNSDYILRDSALLGLPLTVVVALLYGFWNSRRTIILLAAVTALSVLVFAVFKDQLVADKSLLLALLVVPLSGISSLVAVVVAYSSEIYPTRVRSRASGFVAGMTKAGGLLILAFVIATNTPSLAVTAAVGGIPLVLAIVLFTRASVDTHKRPLEEIAAEEAALSGV